MTIAFFTFPVYLKINFPLIIHFFLRNFFDFSIFLTGNSRTVWEMTNFTFHVSHITDFWLYFAFGKSILFSHGNERTKNIPYVLYGKASKHCSYIKRAHVGDIFEFAREKTSRRESFPFGVVITTEEFSNSDSMTEIQHHWLENSH